MSYILDALRKVERERNQPVAPSINFDRPVEPPAKYHWGRYVVIALVLINLIWLAYNAFTPRTINTDEPIKDNKINTVDVPKAPPVETVKKQQPAKTQATQQGDEYQTLDAYKKPSQQKQPSKSPQSISELMASVDNNEALESAQPQPKPVQAVPAQVKPIQPKPAQTQLAKPAPVQTKPIITKRDQTTPANKANKPLVRPPVQPVKPAEKIVPNQVAKNLPKQATQAPRQSSTAERNAANNIPMLRQMPSSFSGQIPPLVINIYVYAEESDSSFVIINMRKYRVGDRIEKYLKLDDIGKDAITLNKNGKKFRIARP